MTWHYRLSYWTDHTLINLSRYFGMVPRWHVREYVIDGLLQPLEEDWPQAVLEAKHVLDHGGWPSQAGAELKMAMHRRLEEIKAQIRRECEEETKAAASKDYDQRHRIFNLETQVERRDEELEAAARGMQRIRDQNQELERTIRNQNKIIADQHYRLENLLGPAKNSSNEEVP